MLGHLDEQGVVTFAVLAGEGSSIRGTELFNRVMDHFGAQVTAVRGTWCKGSSGSESTNIDKVNELTAEGVSLEEAVLQAWTVTRAGKAGFTKVQIVGSPEGRPGHYTLVEVLIEKQPSQRDDDE